MPWPGEREKNASCPRVTCLNPRIDQAQSSSSTVCVLAGDRT